jgi:predicted nucleic acid-binding protein
LKVVFADADYWIALLNPREKLQSKAREVSSRLGSVRIITTEMVLTEVLNGFSNRGEQLRKGAADLVGRLRQNPNITIMPQTSIQFEEARSLYAERGDQAWSLTDCASFQAMQNQKITEALTYDKHFVQAGFKALLRD